MRLAFLALTGKTALRRLSQELRETQAELDYDEDAYTEEGLEFINQGPFTNKEDMVRWPASRGHPRVEVEDPRMDQNDVTRHGTQGSLGNPRSPPSDKVPTIGRPTSPQTGWWFADQPL